MSEWSCRCGAKNGAEWRYCEGCGAENAKAPVRHLAPVPKPAEGYAPWTPPTHPEPAPGDDALIRAEIERAKKLLGGWSTRVDIDPAIPAKVERGSGEPVPIAEILDRQAKGAPR